MKQKKTPATSEEVKSEEVKEEQQSVKIYPDIDFNRKERRKSLIYGALLVILMGGMGASIFIQGLNNPESSTVGYLMGAIMLIFVVIFLSMIPSSFKQYPVDGKPIIEITPKAITINGEAKKISDILEVRLTITLAPVGNKEENEKYVDSLLDKEPEKHMTGNVDFAVKAIGKRAKPPKRFSPRSPILTKPSSPFIRRASSITASCIRSKKYRKLRVTISAKPLRKME